MERSRGDHRTPACEAEKGDLAYAEIFITGIDPGRESTPSRCVTYFQERPRDPAEVRGPTPSQETSCDARGREGAAIGEEDLNGIPNDVAHQTYVIYRLTRWGMATRWLANAGIPNQKPAEVQSAWGPMWIDRNVEQIGIESTRDVCPWNLDEARETGLCINALPGHLSAAVEEEYLRKGDREVKAARLGIEPSAMRRRLTLAYPLLLDLFNAAAAGLPLECDYRAAGRPPKEEQR